MKISTYYTTIILIALLFTGRISYGQCDFSTVPDGDICTKAKYLCGNQLDGFTARLPQTNITPHPWVGLCNYSGSADNIVWFAFTPCDSTVTLRITPFNCVGAKGIQAGMYTRCHPSASVFCSEALVPTFIGMTGPFEMTYDKFIPGKVAYFYVDGMAGEICDFKVDVIEGIDTTPAQDVDPQDLSNGSIKGPGTILCNQSGDTITYRVNLPVCKMNYAQTCSANNPVNIADSVCYIWHVDAFNGGQYSFVDNDSSGTEVKIILTGKNPARFKLSIDLTLHPYYGGGCAKGACGSITPMDIAFAPEIDDFEVINPCPGEIVSFCGQQISTDSLVVCQDSINPCITKRYQIVYKKYRINNLGTIYRCEGDQVEVDGKKYSADGDYDIIDSDECDLRYRFKVKTASLQMVVPNGIRQLDCRNPEIALNAQVTGEFSSDIQYEWKNQSGQIVGIGPQLKVNKPGQYTFRTYVNNTIVNCSKDTIINITANFEKPVFALQVPVFNCRTKNGSLRASSQQNLINARWTTPLGQNIAGIQVNVDSASAQIGGDYRFTAERADNGCSEDTLVTVKADFQRPLVGMTGDGIITCVNPSVRLGYSSSMTPDSVRWTKGNFPGDVYINHFINFYDAVEQNKYYVEVWAAQNGCYGYNEKFVPMDTIYPRISLGTDLLWQCNTTEIALSPNVDRGNNFQYVWQLRQGALLGNAINNADNTALAPGEYILEVLNRKNGCLKTDTLLIERNTDLPQEINFEQSDPLCHNDRNGNIKISGVEGGSQPLRYFLDGKAISTAEIDNLSAGSYQLMVKDKYDCETDTTIVLTDPDLLTAELPAEVEITFGENADLEVLTNFPDSEINEIIWKNVKGEILGRGKNLSFTEQTTQIIEVEVINSNGCKATARVKIIVESEVKFIISNAYRIGSLGNDRFVIHKNKIPAELISFNVYDRWGNTVYTQSSKVLVDGGVTELDFDGNFNGSPLSSGVYMYTMVIKDLFGKTHAVNGDITLLP